ncbi:DUF3055 domain-containing protein [Halobacillus salinarum]|uniref:DUF3055 domain-containing protein n=1 Tax=Halobacillus salinarum TaxID=2932257 RepID=A0ABY4ENL2_9BACI|nr:SAV0927 family protein [Halobacillus salinarum]UOQ46043.1 DUF3055 domain-containing protein [Halobacillus salinarum]
MRDRELLEDLTQDTSTRFVVFTAGNHRFELALLQAEFFQDQIMVIDLQGYHHGLLDQHNINETGYLEHVFQLSQMEAEELRRYLQDLL